MAALYLDDRSPVVGHQHQEVDLHFTLGGVGESHTMQQHVVLTQAGHQRLPHQALRVIREHGMVRLGPRRHGTSLSPASLRSRRRRQTGVRSAAPNDTEKRSHQIVTLLRALKSTSAGIG